MGGHEFESEYSFLINEYLERKELAELGYTSNIDDEDPLALEAFLIIKRQVDAISKENQERAKK